MNKLTVTILHSLNFGHAILFVFLWLFVFPENFRENHTFTFAFLVLFTFSKFVLSGIRFIKGCFASGFVNLVGNIGMNAMLGAYFWDIEQNFGLLLGGIISIEMLCLLITVEAWVDERVNNDTAEMNEDITPVICSPSAKTIRFDHPDFDFVLENTEKDLHFVRENNWCVSTEELHEVETLRDDLYKMAAVYGGMQLDKRSEAECYIEELCIKAEETTETLKNRVAARQLAQIQKVAIKHTL